MIAIDGSPWSLRASTKRRDGIVQKEAIVYYSHVGRFLVVATDRMNRCSYRVYIGTHTRARLYSASDHCFTHTYLINEKYY